MCSERKAAWEAANQLSERLTQYHDQRYKRMCSIAALSKYYRRLEQLQHLIAKAESQRLFLARSRLRLDMMKVTEAIRSDANSLLARMKESVDLDRCNNDSIREVFLDIRALQHEFVDVSVNLDEQFVSATTSSIAFEDVELGPFAIVVEWSRAGDDSPFRYRVTALEPNPSDSDNDIFHPHVQGEFLCEGEARESIRLAIETGRILDLFLIVDHVLKTYNPSSPYVAIKSWYGTPCRDCGGIMNSEEYWTCERCDVSICEQCNVSCNECHQAECTLCMAACERCDANTCRACLSHCDCCDRSVCHECFETDIERCQVCYEEEQAKEKATNT